MISLSVQNICNHGAPSILNNLHKNNANNPNFLTVNPTMSVYPDIASSSTVTVARAPTVAAEFLLPASTIVCTLSFLAATPLLLPSLPLRLMSRRKQQRRGRGEGDERHAAAEGGRGGGAPTADRRRSLAAQPPPPADDDRARPPGTPVAPPPRPYNVVSPPPPRARRFPHLRRHRPPPEKVPPAHPPPPPRRVCRTAARFAGAREGAGAGSSQEAPSRILHARRGGRDPAATAHPPPPADRATWIESRASPRSTSFGYRSRGITRTTTAGGKDGKDGGGGENPRSRVAANSQNAPAF